MSDKDDKKKKKKKDQSIIEAELLAILEKSLKAALDQAMNEMFKDFK